MIRNKHVLAVIPARGGSKGISRKNLRVVAGRSLLAYTVESAKRSRYTDRIVVSSEDDEILAEATRCGAEPLRRPDHLASDDTPGVEPALHAIKALPGFDIVALLQPTSPLRASEDIDACIERCLANGMTACVSVVEADQSPYWMFSLSTDQTLHPIVQTNGTLIAQRQDLPRAYLLNGAVYAAGAAWLASQGTFLRPGVAAWVMPAERSLDIDSESDLAEFSRILMRS